MRALEVGVAAPARRSPPRAGRTRGARAAPPRPPRSARRTCRRPTTAGLPCSSSGMLVLVRRGDVRERQAELLRARRSSTSRNSVSSSRPRSAGCRSSPASTSGPTGCSAKLQRRDDAEVAAAAAQRPEQVGVLVVRGAHQLARRRSPARRRAGCRRPGRACARASPSRRPGSGRRRRWWRRGRRWWPGRAPGGAVDLGPGARRRPPARRARSGRPRRRPCRARRARARRRTADAPVTEWPPAADGDRRARARGRRPARRSRRRARRSARRSAAGARSSS